MLRGIYRPAADPLAQVVTDDPHSRTHLVNLRHSLVESSHDHHRYDHVRYENCGEYCYQRPADANRHQPEQMRHRRIDPSHHKEDAKSPYYAELQAYIPMQVERLVGVVPPPGVEEFIQHPAAKKFYGRRKHHSEQEHLECVLLVKVSVPGRFQHAEDRQHAESVYRANRPIEESPVDYLPFFDRLVSYLRTPPEERIHQEVLQSYVNDLAHFLTISSPSSNALLR